MRYLTQKEKTAQLQDRHKSQPIYLVGCGLSLTSDICEDLEDTDVLLFGVNRSFDMIRLTYHLHVDYEELLKKRYGQFSMQCESYLQALIDEGTYLFAPLNHHYEKTTGLAHYYFYSDFQATYTVRHNNDNETLNLGHSSTSIYHALQIAEIMGCDPIMTIGVDFKMEEIRPGFLKSHAYTASNKMLDRDLQGIEDRRLKFERDLETKGKRKLVNIGQGYLGLQKRI